jgi:uncharacterized BrkB/YihY/UPF0761 family membrane protein
MKRLAGWGRKELSKRQNIKQLLGRLFGFLGRVVRGFMRNQGLLLSGALAYYTLLSIVPMSILLLTGLSHFMAEEDLISTLSTYTGMVIPGYSAILANRYRHSLSIVKRSVSLDSLLCCFSALWLLACFKAPCRSYFLIL